MYFIECSQSGFDPSLQLHVSPNQGTYIPLEMCEANEVMVMFGCQRAMTGGRGSGVAGNIVNQRKVFRGMKDKINKRRRGLDAAEGI